MSSAVESSVSALLGADARNRTECAWAFARALDDFTPREVDERLHDALLRALASDAAFDVNVARVAAAYIKLEHGGDELNVETAQPRPILDNALAHALLRTTMNVDLGIEHLAQRARRRLLLDHAGAAGSRQRVLQSVLSLFDRGRANVAAHVPQMLTFALQSFQNNYVMAERADERYLLDRLEPLLAKPAAPVSHSLACLLYAMYRPLAHAVASDAVPLDDDADGYGAALEELFDITVHAVRELEVRAQNLTQVGKSRDAVSVAVQSQYERSPYPRWTGLGPQPVHQFTTFRSQFPFMPERERNLQPVRMLVAGCGTGLQAATLALQFPDARITATDVSRTSLAYAQAQAERHGLENIEFVYNDVLSVGALDIDFDVVECVGVLNHLNEPFPGLEALLRVLKPRGLLRLGLYSETGRALVNQGRARIAELELEASHRDIVEYRQRIIEGREPAALQALARGPDFYDAHMFRDLLFNVAEHQFTLPQIEAWLEYCDLAFAGFELPSPAVEKDYKRRYPKDKRMTSLDSWHHYEQEKPDTFRNMYRFWCVRKPAHWDVHE